jgi:hypothetical protein
MREIVFAEIRIYDFPREILPKLCLGKTPVGFFHARGFRIRIGRAAASQPDD